MKRVIGFLLALVLAVGGIGAAHGILTDRQDEVLIYPAFEWGDAAAVAGRTLDMTFDYGTHLRWDSSHHFGSGETDTVFAFDYKGFSGESSSIDRFDISMSLDFGAEIMQLSQHLTQHIYGDMVRAVAIQTPDGESRTQELKMREYVPYYLLDVYIDFNDGNQECWITEGTHEWLSSGYGSQGREPSVEALHELFRFPVREEELVEVTVTRTDNGQIVGYDFSSKIQTELRLDGKATSEGIYFLPVFQDETGAPLPYEAPQGHGLYFVPWVQKEGENRQLNNGKVIPCMEPDFSGLRLVASLEQVSVEQLTIEEDCFRLLTREAGKVWVSLLDLQTGQLLAKTEAFPEPEGFRFAQMEREGDYLLVSCYEELALLDAATGALLLTAPAESPGEQYYGPVAFTAAYGDLRYDGETLIIANRGENKSTAFWLQVYRQGEIVYHGEFDASLMRGGVGVQNWSDLKLK